MLRLHSSVRKLSTRECEELSFHLGTHGKWVGGGRPVERYARSSNFIHGSTPNHLNKWETIDLVRIIYFVNDCTQCIMDLG
jgi:hypothetical protein